MIFTKIHLLAVILAFALLFSSCSDDSSTSTPITPPSNVIFTWDSLGVNVTGPNSLSSQQTSLNQTISATKVKVEYRLVSNADTSFCKATFSDSTNGTPSRPSLQTLYGPVDSTYSFELDVPAQPFYVKYYVSMRTLSSTIPYYIYFKGIKITKVQ